MPPKNKRKGPKAPKPAFDEVALSQLTAKIDSNLSQSKEGRPEKRKRIEHDSRDANPKKRQAQEPKSNKSRPRKAGEESSSSLLDEIKLLGGDESDLELVIGVDSDAEEGQPANASKPSSEVDKAFQKELAKFASGLGFEKVREESVAADDEPEDEEQEEEEVEEVSDFSEDEGDAAEPAPPPEKPQNQKKKGKLEFEGRPDWHAVELTELPEPASDDIRNFSATIGSLKTYAQSLLEADSSAYSSMVASSSTQKFMSTIMSSGTMSDKVSALTLAIQESPVHSTKALENLIGLAGKKSRGQAIAALGALVDLLGNGVVLPSDRRLRPFYTQPGLLGVLQKHSVNSWRSGQSLPGKLTNAHLISWAFEDWLKDAYFRIIQLLEVWCNDEIEYSRTRSLDFVFGLLRDKPEQEANLLRLLVNKLGDRERKIASRASYLLLQLLVIHPGMKAVVISTMEQEVILRPGETLRTKYYAINTLNQTILSSKEPTIAETLVRIYFELFVSLLKMGVLGSASEAETKGSSHSKQGKGKKNYKNDRPSATPAVGTESEIAEKLVSAILTGVNRAIPFATTDESTLEKHIDTLFRITHSSNFNTSIQALMLIQQLSVSKHLVVDRFYRTLYESLLDPRLITSSKQALYLNLLFRSLKNDVDVRRVKAFVKRMLQVIHLHQAPFVCGILFTISELEGTFPDLKTLINEPEENPEDEEEVYRDVPTEPVAGGETEGKESRRAAHAYDGRKRDPQYSNAQNSCLWEVTPYFHHFHPSVAVFAANLLARQKDLPKPELANHTLMHFLDKFVYRNPKATDGKRGSSIMQPVLAAGSATNVVVPTSAGSKQQASVNTAAFWNKKQEDVAAEDVFFHEYFNQVGKPAQAATKAAKAKKAAGEDEEDEEAEEEIWDALVNSRPEIGGEDDDDVDLDMGSDDESDLGSLLSLSDEGEDESLGSEIEEAGEAMSEDGEDGGAWAQVDVSDESEAEPTDKKKRRMSRKEFKSLPTFASADDYAEMLAAEELDF